MFRNIAIAAAFLIHLDAHTQKAPEWTEVEFISTSAAYYSTFVDFAMDRKGRAIVTTRDQYFDYFDPANEDRGFVDYPEGFGRLSDVHVAVAPNGSTMVYGRHEQSGPPLIYTFRYAFFDWETKILGPLQSVVPPPHEVDSNLKSTIEGDQGGDWMAIWKDGGTFDFAFYSMETDEWSTPAPLPANPPGLSTREAPQLAADSNGNWLAVWSGRQTIEDPVVEHSVLSSIYSESNGTWSALETINAVYTQTITGSFSQCPVVDIDTDGLAVCLWYGKGNGDGSQGTWYSRKNLNKGNWSEPKRVRDEDGQSHGFIDSTRDLATDNDGNWVFIWHRDLYEHPTDITRAYSSRYVWKKNAWSPASIVGETETTRPESIYGDVLGIATDYKGNWIAARETTFNPVSGGIANERVPLETYAMNASAAKIETSDADDSGGSGSGTCFIATAAYGTPLAQEIDALRHIRDDSLLTHPLGTALVDTYYRFSPPLADAVAKTPILAATVRMLLTVVIALVQSGIQPVILLVSVLTILRACKARRILSSN